jgi:hypothetical protein
MARSVVAIGVVALVLSCGGRQGLDPPSGTAGSSAAGSTGASSGAAGSTRPSGAAGVMAAAGASGPGAAGASGVAGATGTAGAASERFAPATVSNACFGYCRAIMGYCTGVNAQYADRDECLAACSFLPEGAPTDETGNSVGCRAQHAGAAFTDPMPVKPECWAAGPLGYGSCGDECDAFCAIAMTYCSSADGYRAPPPYASLDDCHNTCVQYNRVVEFGQPGSYSADYAPPMDPSLVDTLECRAYHLIVQGLLSHGAQQVQCPFASADSAACGQGTF